jgi:shikimate dehydrogenase
MPSVLDCIENKNINIDDTEYYAAILGESPSKGAKSPVLWNAAFQGLNLPGIMHPMDVQPERLENLVSALRKDLQFIGGAITMPYKISIIPFLDDIELEAKAIGAVNCIYRDKDKLIGTNTDGAGALWSLENEMEGSMIGKQICLLGAGGAGFAVAAYLASAIGINGSIVIVNRSIKSCNTLAAKLEGKCSVSIAEWPVSSEEISNADILVNCTSIGFETVKKDSGGAFSLRGYTALGPVADELRVENGSGVEKRYCKSASTNIRMNFDKSLELLTAMNDPFIFDIIYQPELTMLLFISSLLGYRTLNGKAMNLEQAVIAFDKATAVAGIRKSNTKQIRSLMKSV